MDSDQLYVGIGIEIERMQSRVTIREIFAGSPAGEVGLLAGDQIVGVEEENTEDFTVSEIMKVLRGKEGSTVNIAVNRPSTGERVEVSVSRRKIDLPSIRDFRLLDTENAIGYIRLTQFGRHSADEFSDALDALEGQGMRALIFDLRNNPGGILPVAVDIVGQFVGQGEVVVTTKGRDEGKIAEEVSQVPARAKQYPIAVLINGHSASASEVVSGALQDYEKAIVVGEASYGKGSVQSILGFGNGDGLRMTTAMYYLPSGRTIHKVGVEPDIEVSISDDEKLKLFTQRNHQALIDNAEFSTRFGFEPIEDPQILAAKEVLLGVLAF